MNQPRMNRAMCCPEADCEGPGCSCRTVPPLPIVEDTAALYRVTIKPAGTVGRYVVRNSRAFATLGAANRYAERELEQGLGVQMTRQDGQWWVVVMAVEASA